MYVYNAHTLVHTFIYIHPYIREMGGQYNFVRESERERKRERMYVYNAHTLVHTCIYIHPYIREMGGQYYFVRESEGDYMYVMILCV